jgi:hypothetical protein
MRVLLARARVFQGISEQVQQDLAEKSGIGLDLRQITDNPLDLTIAGLLGEVADGALDQGWKFNRCLGQLGPCSAREREQIINQTTHCLADSAMVSQVTADSSSSELAVVPLGSQQNLRYGGEGRASHVNRITKGLELLVGGLELDGAFAHSLFEIGVEASNLFLGTFAFSNIMGNHLRSRFAGKNQRRGGNFHVDGCAVQSQELLLEKRHRFAILPKLLQTLMRGLPMSRVQDFFNWSPH